MNLTWQQELLWLAVLYRLLERGDSVPVEVEGSAYAFIADELHAMQAVGLLEARGKGGFLHPTSAAHEALGRLLAMHDQAQQFSIFRSVNLTVELKEGESDDGEAVYEHSFDPRFALPVDEEQAEQFGTEDLRLAMITWVSRTLSAPAEERDEALPEVDPRRVVFLHMLEAGRFTEESLWFDLALGSLFGELEEVVEAAYQATDVSDDPLESQVILESMYRAGMLERRKREGRRCPACALPLGAYDLAAGRDGEPLSSCPSLRCGEGLPPLHKAAGKGGCARCGADAEGKACSACGARLVYLTDSEDDEVWVGRYGYVPGPGYDPLDLGTDREAFGALLAKLF
jgi:hypothetical protein